MPSPLDHDFNGNVAKRAENNSTYDSDPRVLHRFLLEAMAETLGRIKQDIEAYQDVLQAHLDHKTKDGHRWERSDGRTPLSAEQPDMQKFKALSEAVFLLEKNRFDADKKCINTTRIYKLPLDGFQELAEAVIRAMKAEEASNRLRATMADAHASEPDRSGQWDAAYDIPSGLGHI